MLVSDHLLGLSTIVDAELMFMDECGFSTHTIEKFGYAPKGISPAVTVPCSKGANVTLLALISPLGMPISEVFTGGLKSEMLADFFRSPSLKGITWQYPICVCRLKVGPFASCIPGVKIVLDNAPVHRSQLATHAAWEAGLDLQYLPPYSPQLNPIEEVFAMIKYMYKGARPRPKNAEQVKAIVQGIALQLVHFDFMPHYGHMRHFLNASFNMIPFPDWPPGVGFM